MFPTPFRVFLDHEASVSILPLVTSYSDRIKKKTLKEKFYTDHNDGDDEFYYVFNGRFVEFLGLRFVFDDSNGSNFYVLIDKGYSSLDLICIAESFFRFMGSVNKRGYVTETENI